MKKIDLGQTINTLANVGVIAGIVFLGYEMRQNTQVARQEAYGTFAQSVIEVGHTITSNPQLADLIAQIQDGKSREEFAPLERVQRDLTSSRTGQF